MSDKFTSGPGFLVHVPVHPRGTDPSRNDLAFNQPAPVRETKTFAWIFRGRHKGSGLIGRMAGAITPATADITCTQANVTPGNHVIRVGSFTLLPAVDFDVGASDNALADNLAAAIDALPGFSAPNPAANVVTVSTTAGHGDDVRIEILEPGAASAFALGALDREGFMDLGAPAPSPPSFT